MEAELSQSGLPLISRIQTTHLQDSIFVSVWKLLIHRTRLTRWRESICFREGHQVKGSNTVSKPAFYRLLLFNLAAVYGIRLMAVKWLRHKHGPSAEKALGNCQFQRLRKKDEGDILLY